MPESVCSVESLSPAAVRGLMPPAGGPCISLYLPTHRNVPENTVDVPTFRGLVALAARRLEAWRPAVAAEGLLAPLAALADDRAFWQHAAAGLAVLAAPAGARLFRLERPVAPLAVVADRFHLLPLVTAAAALEAVHLLLLTSRRATVLGGTAWHDPRGCTLGPLVPVPVRTAAGAAAEEWLDRERFVDAEVLEPHRVAHGMGPAGRAAGAIVHGGWGGRRDDVEDDTAIYLRCVDELVAEQVSAPSGRPLVLVADDRLAAAFRRVSRNPLLLPAGVAVDPHLLDERDVAARAAAVLAMRRAGILAGTLADYEAARGGGLSAWDLADVARAAVGGRVATVFVEEDRFEPGACDPASGAIERAAGPGMAAGDPARSDDLLDAVATAVTLHGGDVVALRRIDMPTDSGVAAILRW